MKFDMMVQYCQCAFEVSDLVRGFFMRFVPYRRCSLFPVSKPTDLEEMLNRCQLLPLPVRVVLRFFLLQSLLPLVSSNPQGAYFGWVGSAYSW